MTKQTKFSPIAVVGASGLFPGSIGGQSFWRNILAGEDFMSDVPEDHWLIDDYYDPQPGKKGKIYGNRGAFLPKVDFDPMQFGMPPKQLSTTDSAQLLGLIVAAKVLEDANSVQFGKVDKSDISVILGVASATEMVGQMASRIQRPHWIKALRDAGIPESKVVEVCDGIEATYPEWDESTFPGLLGNVVAGRIANRLDLGGTNCVVDAACASSLGAVSMAIRELQAGDSNLVITGGVDALNDTFMYMCFSQTPALSPTGDCRPFSADADGTMLGEGIGMVALRRLEDAERDGDRIYAVIRGVGSSSDGKSGSIYAPESRGQALAIRRAYAMTDYDVDEVELIEAHGTATKAGDAAEFGGLQYAFEAAYENAIEGPEGKKQWCALGSVKSQIGHTKSAAGSASLFKVVMALHHKVLPPTIKVSKPNPALKIDESPFYLSTETRPWIHDPKSTRKASVSSFGFGGSNFHVALEEHVSTSGTRGRYHASPVELLLFSADTAKDLVSQTKLLTEQLGSCSIATLASQLQKEFVAAKQCRLAIIAEDGQSAITQIEQAGNKITAQPDEPFSMPNKIHYGTGGMDGKDNVPPKIGFLFPGQGSQYVNMGADIACEFDQARAAWDIASTVDIDSEYRLDQVVYPIPVFSDADRDQQNELLTSTHWAQPAIGCVSASMLNLLQTLEVKPDAVAGHSYGEVTALYAAGALTSQESFLAVSRRRGELMKQAASIPGSMTAVRAGRDEVQGYLDQWDCKVVIANINSPSQVVIAGETAEIEKAEQELGKVGATFQRLTVATAFHTDIVSPSAEPFHEFLADIKISKPRVPVYSNTTAAPYSNNLSEIRKTLAWQLANPVRFQESIEQMHDDGIRLFVEVGPSSLLAGMVKDCLKGREFSVVSLDNRKLDGRAAFWNSLGSLSVEGVALNYDALWQDFAEAEALPESIDRSPVTIKLSGANHGKPYPPENGSAGLPAPNPEVAPVSEMHVAPANVVAPAANNVPEAVSPASVPQQPAIAATVAPALSPVRDANWVAAFQSLQEQTLQAQISFQQTLGDAHQSFLRASEVAFSQLGGIPVSAEIQVPITAQVAAPIAQLGVEVPAVAEAPVQTSTPLPVQAQAIEPAFETPDFERMLLDIVAEKTGYPQEMLTLDMELESGLGIDSIKRVEILSTLQEQMPHLGELDTAELAELNTLGEIIEFAAASGPTVPSTTTPAAISVVGGANTTDLDFESMLLDVVAEKTGYPKEMLTLDMELESGLGIDSIKRVEILSTLQEQIPSLGEMDTAELAELNTLGEIIELASASAPAAASNEALSTDAASQIDFESMLLDVVAEKTGYPKEMLSLDMELESGLGIDSIKRVEILSSLQEQIPHVGEMDTAELAELNTLGEIIDFVSGGAISKSPASSASTSTSSSQTVAAESQASTELAEMTRFEVRTESRQATGIAIGNIEKAAPLYLVGDRTGVAEQLSNLLASAGVVSEVVEVAPEDAKWLVLLTGLNASDETSVEEQINLNVEAFEQVRRCAASMLDSGYLLVTVQATGGEFGLSAGTGTSAWSAGIAALAKTASREWPEVAVKAIDVQAADMSVERVAQELFGELIAGGPELEVGLRSDGQRMTLVARPNNTPTEAVELPDDCVILVSGGARGVTAACLQELLDRRPAKLAILGRTPLTEESTGLADFATDAELKKALLAQHTQAGHKVTPIELNREVSNILNMREVRTNLARLTATGSTVMYLPTDISDADSTKASIVKARDELGPINVIVHAAGVLADKEIHKKTDEQFKSVFNTKVHGLLNLLDATRSDPLTHLVCFSSVAARTGNTGQVDYAIANEILNRVSQSEQSMRGEGFTARSIGWGPWAGGMVDPGLAGHFRAQGIELIPLEDGAALFADEVEGRNGDCVEIVYGGGLDSEQADSDNGTGNKSVPIRQMSIRVHVSQHPQISSHLIQGKPVVPLALVNEWGLSLAAALNPSLNVVGVHDLSVVKGIELQAFETEGDWLNVVCERNGEFLSMTVTDLEGNAHYQMNLQLSDDIAFESSHKEPAEPEHPALELDKWEWTPKHIYQELLFHGEKLQVVKQLLGVSEAGCRALLQMPDESDLARWRVAMLDGGLQLALLWERKRSGLASLPTKFGQMKWHHQGSTPGGPVTCELMLKKATNLMATWSIVFTNVEKQIIATMEDVNIHVLLAKASGTPRP